MPRSETTGAIAKAMSNFQSALHGGVEHTGENKFKEYTYVELSEICRVIREPLAKAGLMIDQDVIKGGVSEDGKGYYVEMATTVTHTSGEWISVLSVGLGTNGDKSPYSAMTGARKYGLLAVSNLGTGPEDDPAAYQQQPMPQGPAEEPVPQIGEPDVRALRNACYQRIDAVGLKASEHLVEMQETVLATAGYNRIEEVLPDDLDRMFSIIDSWDAS